MKYPYRQTVLMVGSGLLATAQHGLASTGTTLDGATSTFQNLFLLGVFLLGFAGLATIVYTVARNRYGIIWDEALSVVKAVAVGASAVTILGWVGSTAAAPIVPQMAQEVVDVFAMWP